MNPVQFTKRVNALVYHHASMGSTRYISVMRAKLKNQGYVYCRECKLWIKPEMESCGCRVQS